MAQAYEGRGRRNGSARAAVRSRANDVLEDFEELRKDVGKLADAVNKVAKIEVNQAGTRLDELNTDLRQRAAETAAYVRDRASESASYLRDRATEGAGYLRERANEGATVVGERVRERPFAAVGISLGVGVLLGLAMSRR